ncbi:MAG: YIP1 family protein [Chitinophagaceae bacterium]|nr:YIP1 family protein [Chitinophagaceae bacterium]MBK7678952.1 YIP1 family protein [Chitinophagaceae bacterium]MBK8299705.1 YIP1 family protein [Chitinophagaceae bacterium]MBK9463754.1 YIP1 family protein [Chitinophagaceae bacterium]MBL0067576.1 YIP1 family protein [Chitinophagaceae bacterium]
MNLIDRAKKILLTPKTEWDVVNSETPNTQSILTTYVIPLVAIGAIASFIGWGFIGKSYSYGFGSVKVSGVSLGIRYALIALIGGIAGCFLLAFVIDALAPTFKSEKDFGRSFQLAAYSSTAGWVGAVLNILPSLAIIGSLVGLYGLYLLYLGLPKLKKTPQEQSTGYFIASLVAMIVASFVIGLILAAILVPKSSISAANINF